MDISEKLTWVYTKNTCRLSEQVYAGVAKHRKKLLKRNTDRLFITGGKGRGLDAVFTKILKHVRQHYPQVINLYHLRTSLNSHWLNEHGLMEAIIISQESGSVLLIYYKLAYL